MKRKHAAIDLEKKCSIVTDYKDGKKSVRLGEGVWTIAIDVSTIIRSAEKFNNEKCSAGNGCKHVRQGVYKEVEEALYKWFLRAHVMNLPTTEPILVRKEKQFALMINNMDFQPGGGWIQCFRHGIICKAVTGEGTSLDVDARQRWVEETLPRILDNYTDAHIYSGNETGLFLQMLPFKTRAKGRLV